MRAANRSTRSRRSATPCAAAAASFPADGFYDWKDEGGRKRPYCVRPQERRPIAFAGLWETWMGPNGEEMETATIVTTAAKRELARCTTACR